jgi:hypothetical protein
MYRYGIICLHANGKSSLAYIVGNANYNVKVKVILKQATKNQREADE